MNRRERIYTRKESFPISMKIGMRYKKLVRVEKPRFSVEVLLFMLLILTLLVSGSSATSSIWENSIFVY